MNLEQVGMIATSENLNLRLRGLLYLMAYLYDPRTGLCCPSKATLAERGDVSTRTIQRDLKELEERGIIEREERFVDGRQVTTNYKLRGAK